MKLSEKYSVRLQTGNFKKVNSNAAKSIDYDARKKIIEIEFISGEIYHYCDANKNEWATTIEFAKKGEGLGTYLNQVFKKLYKTNERVFYKLNMV